MLCIRNSIHLCTKCHVCDVGYSLAVELLLVTKVCHHFESTWKLFHFPLICMRTTLELKIFAKNVLRKFSYWNCEQVKKVL